MTEDEQTQAIESVLRQFRVDGHVDTITRGPSVTRFEIKIGDGVRIEKLARLQKNFAYATAAESVRIVAPIPGKSAIGIELPRPGRATVSLRDIPVDTDKHPLTVPIGVDIEGDAVTGNLAEMPHLLIAGTTGSGKSSFINSMLVSLLDTDPEDVRIVLIDPKMVELTPYDGVAHLVGAVITEVYDAITALAGLVQEMENRYQAMRHAKTRSIEGLGFPYVVVVIDELADLMLQGRDEVEPLLVRLLQKARAAGIHLVLATQRPSVDVLTGLLKANAPSRLAFSTASLVDSRVIIDEPGAEQLLGAGDGLYCPVGARTAIRIQSAYVTDEEVSTAVQRATAVARVEQMVHEIHDVDDNSISALEYFNQVIADAKTVGQRTGAYLEELATPKSLLPGGRAAKIDLLAQAPIELGMATDTLLRLAEDLEELRDAMIAE